MLLCVLTAVLPGCKKDEVARVNDVVITRAQLLDQLEKDYGAEAVQRLVNQAIIRQAFDRAGLQFPQEKVEGQIQDMRNQAGTEEAFQQFVAMKWGSEENLRLDLEIQTKVTMLAEKDVQVTEEQLKAYYKENEPRYKQPARVSFSEIALPDRKQAEDVRTMAAKPGASFSDLAKQYSVAESQPFGGRLPTMTEEDIKPAELRPLVMKLEPSKVSEPFRAGQLWYIILVHERLPAKKLSFEEARDTVEQQYKGERMVPQRQLWEQMTGESNVRIVDSRYAYLQRLYLGADLLTGPGGGPGLGPAGAAKGATEAPPPAVEPKAEAK